MKMIIGGALAIVVALALVLTGRPFANEVHAGQTAANPVSIEAARLPAAHDNDNPVLGYSISLPNGYSRTQSWIVAGQELLGADTYTSLTPGQDRDRCQTDHGSTPTFLAAYFSVEVYRNDAGLSAAQWSSTRRSTPRRTVQPGTINGTDAAKQVDNGKTSGYVFQANGRIYLLFSIITPSQHPLDAIAASFTALQPQAAPASTATQPPRDAARDLAQKLAAAFQNRDADAVAALTTTECSLGVSAIVEPVQPGDESCCVLNRAVTPFIKALRVSFANRSLTVTVNPDVQTQAVEGGERYFVRSTWEEAGRTTPVDLLFGYTKGQWRWVRAVHHYQRADLNLQKCVPYGNPWRSGAPSC